MVVGEIKTIIFGANGMLGNDLCKFFPDSIKFGHKDVDITDLDKVTDTLAEIRPDVVINAAAYTNVDGCEDEQEIAFVTNGEGPGYLAKACAESGAVLVHYSTDYVFDGSKKEYFESDTTNPINIYGKSKLLGEKRISDQMEDFRIIRTSWLFGLKGNNFVNTMLELSGKMETVKVVNDQFGKPTYTSDLACKTLEIIDKVPGIYHITNEGVCSWYEFSSAIIDNVSPCSSAEFPRKARRPKYSILANSKTSPMRHWKEALRDYLEERKI
jgi:dTDP-4-dehydrorhamnose reductase